MVRRLKRTKRCFAPADVGAVARVRFPLTSGERWPPPPLQVSTYSRPQGSFTTEVEQEEAPCCSFTTEEEQRCSGVMKAKTKRTDQRATDVKMKVDRSDEAAPEVHPEELQGSCAPCGGVPAPEQQGAAEHCTDSRSPELQSVGSLTVTIQQRSQNRRFGQTEQRLGLQCHVCKVSCDSMKGFQAHMSGPEHLQNLQDVTQWISQNSRLLQHRGRRLQTQRWCDACQTHFSGNVIVHRQTQQHKVCKQLSRPFCPVCKRHFRTPRKFVEHMKSVEHKEQVQQDEAQEEELITVDAVGCFEEEQQRREEEEEEEEQVEGAEDGRVEEMLSKDQPEPRGGGANSDAASGVLK